MASFIRAYNAALLRRPLFVNCTTAAVLFGAGDVLAQQAIERRGNEHDYTRTARLTLYGGTLFGPGISVWYAFLNRLKFASPRKAVIYRVWLDQAVFAPFVVAFFFGAMSVLEGKPHEAVDRIQNGYVPTLLRNWCVFVPTQAINFSIIPPHLRFVTVSVVGLFWNSYLSLANTRANKEKEIEHKEL